MSRFSFECRHSLPLQWFSMKFHSYHPVRSWAGVRTLSSAVAEVRFYSDPAPVVFRFNYAPAPGNNDARGPSVPCLGTPQGAWYLPICHHRKLSGFPMLTNLSSDNFTSFRGRGLPICIHYNPVKVLKLLNYLKVKFL